MDEIKQYVYNLLKNDATMQSYTGYTASDPRIYEWFPAIDPTLSSTLPGYIVYRAVSYGRPAIYVDRAQEGDIFLHFDILTYNSDTKGLISRRILYLCDHYGAFSTTNFRVLNLEIVENFEMGVEGESSIDRKYRHHVTVRAMAVLNKNVIGNI